ncbi:tyrosine-protein phosphatase [Novosphingobium malaysiense]|uniref:Protein tyrosine phosphatase n=1 Tax=Novosphingobium malaysiense TaxID=1348853 RepID=A0A0B1ZD22_9SPHN|nr:tyrosine-protein phosphatase [Novosphingobium malaysiense]KHK88954.1 hypothetical protein LK12_22915 [Novosphingobium malaysiense]
MNQQSSELAREEVLATYVNLRDLGGVPAIDGKKTVRRGMVFRSAMPRSGNTQVTAALSSLSLASVVDLRNETERKSVPAPWAGLGCDNYISIPDAAEHGDLAKLWKSAIDGGIAEVKSLMLQQYRGFAETHAPLYKLVFEQLAAGKTPLLFHCTAGKDRTGAAAALLLAALAVPREYIMRDYLLTNAFNPVHAAWVGGNVPGSQTTDPARREAIMAMMVSQEQYLGAMFDALTAQFGTVERYLDEALGFDRAALSSLRANLLTDA